jgi:hypothetical protein
MAMKNSPIGFGRTPMPDEAGNDVLKAGRPLAERSSQPPLVKPLALDDMAVYEILQRYQLQPLVPLAKFEYQLVELIAALEQRIRELDPDL